MALDPVVNFGKVTASTGYSAGATSVVLTAGQGAVLPQPSTAGAFNLVWWNSTDYGDPSGDPNVEIVRVTARSTDTLTVTRAQESTTASTKNTAGKTYSFILAPTAKMITDVGSAITAAGLWSVGVSGGQTVIGGTGPTDSLKLQSTSGVGATGANINFNVGNNGGTTAMTILNSGNVGIGTTAPTNNLQVGTLSALSTATPVTLSLGGTYSSTAGANPKLKLYDTGTSVYGFGVSLDGIDYISSVSHVWWNNGTASMMLTASGNVGIGTKIGTYAPTSRVQIALGGGSGANAPTSISLANNYLQIGGTEYANSGYETIGFGYAVPSNTYMPAYIGFQYQPTIAGQTMGDLIFGTRNVTTDTVPTERMRITAAGNVGIGTTGPSYKLDVQGGDIGLGTVGGRLRLKAGSNGSTGSGTLSSGTATIANTSVTATSIIIVVDTGSSITNLGSLQVSSKTAGTGFTVQSSNVLDTSTFTYILLELY